MEERIYIKYFDDELIKLHPIANKSDWIDLRAAKDMTLKKGDFALIPLGVAMKLPDKYEAHLAPRSSTFKTWGLIQTNSMGVIDQSFCGDDDEWMMPVYATRDTEVKKNDRICQFRIDLKQPTIIFEELKKLSSVNRGGFGSTGTK